MKSRLTQRAKGDTEFNAASCLYLFCPCLSLLPDDEDK